MKNVAILVDGGFYRQCSKKIFGDITPEERAEELVSYCKLHLETDGCKHELYRIFYYDCPPLDKNVYHLFSKKDIDMKNTQIYKWTSTFLQELKSKRKVALRLGTLAHEQACYNITIESLKELLDNRKSITDLTDKDFRLNVDQKGVDMRIGLDIASLAYKKQVDQIVLISGDSDFVPAAKLARREGIDFILDSMGKRVKDNLYEHIDGLITHHKEYKDGKNPVKKNYVSKRNSFNKI